MEQQDVLVRKINDLKIKSIMFSVAESKSPSDSGFNSTFFKKTWSTRSSIVEVVKSFFRSGRLLKQVNFTDVASRDSEGVECFFTQGLPLYFVLQHN